MNLFTTSTLAGGKVDPCLSGKLAHLIMKEEPSSPVPLTPPSPICDITKSILDSLQRLHIQMDGYDQ